MRSRIVSAFAVGADIPADESGLDLPGFSRFKHGSVAPAWRFAGHLVTRLATASPETVLAERLVATASCFKYLPLASVALTRAVAHLINRVRVTAGLPPVTQTQLYRHQLIEGDYSTMSLEQRRRFIATDTIEVDHELVEGATVLVVDDVRITGFHEGRISALLAAAGVAAVTFAYWAAIDGRADPTLEKRLNETSIADLESLERLIATDRFVLNSRACKLILSAPQQQLAAFLPRLAPTVLTELVAGMECNGYAVMPTYRPAYQLMLSILRTRVPQEVA